MIILYTKDHCPYCIKAKNLLASLGATFDEVNITHDPDMFTTIYAKSHMRTVPQIFVGEECLGGYDDIAALHDQGILTTKLGI